MVHVAAPAIGAMAGGSCSLPPPLSHTWGQWPTSSSSAKVGAGRDFARPAMNWPTGPSSGVKGSRSLRGAREVARGGDRGRARAGDGGCGCECERESARVCMRTRRLRARRLHAGTRALVSMPPAMECWELRRVSRSNTDPAAAPRSALHRNLPPRDEDGRGYLRQQVPGLGACRAWVSEAGESSGTASVTRGQGGGHRKAGATIKRVVPTREPRAGAQSCSDLGHMPASTQEGTTGSGAHSNVRCHGQCNRAGVIA